MTILDNIILYIAIAQLGLLTFLVCATCLRCVGHTAETTLIDQPSEEPERSTQLLLCLDSLDMNASVLTQVIMRAYALRHSMSRAVIGPGASRSIISCEHVVETDASDASFHAALRDVVEKVAPEQLWIVSDRKLDPFFHDCVQFVSEITNQSARRIVVA